MKSHLIILSIESGFMYGNNRKIATVKCECGTIKKYLLQYVTSKRVRCCGSKCKFAGHSTLGLLSKHTLYRVWNGMKERCYYRKNKLYHRYGGRGIIICKQWLRSYISFEKWALKNGWEKGLQIDRRNNNGNYSPRNCRIVTKLENSRNQERTVYINFKNKRLRIKEWAILLNINPSTIKNRRRRGWPVKYILSKKNMTVRGNIKERKA